MKFFKAEVTKLSLMFNNLLTPQVGGAPVGVTFTKPAQPQRKVPTLIDQNPGLPHRVVHYNADTSGCGLWRMSWPAHLINFHNKAMVTELMAMVGDPNWYKGVKVIRIQRQATPEQREFVRFLKGIQPQIGFRLVYEVDDVVFGEEIPDYNLFKHAFTSPEIRQSAIDIMNMCDEITVTCDFMRELYRSKTGKQEITVIPNFVPRFWMGNYFDPNRLAENFNKHKKRPRILYNGSGAHFDVNNVNGQRDDFTHVIDAIVKTRQKYQWVFMGAVPLALHPFVQNGEIEFHQWQRLYDYPKKINDLEIQMMVAPLQDNNFNKSKSDLKYIEACCYGMPVACQDMCTYENADLKFKTGDEMLALIEQELGSSDKYKYKAKSLERYKVAENRFLEHDRNIDCYMDLYTYPYGDPRRTNLARYNP